MPGIELLWDDEALRDLLNRHLVAALLGGARVTEVSVRRQTYRPGRQAFALCDLTLEDGRREAVTISFAKDDRLERAHRKSYSARWSAGHAAYLADYGCLVERFPYDWQAPAIASLFRPERLTRLLDAADAGAYEVAAAQGRPRVLSYRPHESGVVLLPGLKLPGGALLVAKAMAERDRVARFHHASMTMRASTSRAEVWTPRTFRPRREPRVLFMEFAPGQPVLECEDLEGSVRLAGLALAEVHATPPHSRSRRRQGLGDRLQHARSRVARARLVAPELAAAATAVLDRVERLVVEVGPVRPAFIHGDYKSSQLLAHDGRVAIIDLDTAAAGDPAIDVGNFLADLNYEALTSGRRQLLGLEDVFLRAYLAEVAGAGIAQRAALFRVIALVRRAIHDFRQLAGQYSSREDYVPIALVREAEACLQAL